MTSNSTLTPLARRVFAEQFFRDKYEWKRCAKMIQFAMLSKASLLTFRSYMHKCWFEDMLLDGAFRLVFNNGKGSSLMVPDEIVFQFFRIVQPTEIRLCGHFKCDQQRLEQLVEYDKHLGITGLEIYKLSSPENAKFLLKCCARQLRYLACEVEDLEDFLRSPIELDKYLAYHTRNVESALSWIFKAVDVETLDLGIKPFIEFSLNFDGPVRQRLKHLKLIASVQRRNNVFEFLSVFKLKAPNLNQFTMDFYCKQPDNWTTFLSEVIAFKDRLETCIRSVQLNFTILMVDDYNSYNDKHFLGYPIKTEKLDNVWSEMSNLKLALIDIPITLTLTQETPGFCFEDV